jgi:hypothetical protein
MIDVDLSESSRGEGDQYTDLEFYKHVATLFDGNHEGYIKCDLFEVGNEPDINNLPPTADGYMSVWNTFVTEIKAIRPDAKFIGPVLAGYNYGWMESFLNELATNEYPIPDAISWHYYGCGWGQDQNWDNCFERIATENPTVHAADVRAKMQDILGYQLPIGITEWSADSSPSGMDNMAYAEPQMSQYVAQTLQDMIDGEIDFANQFCVQSYAAEGILDMIDSNNVPRPYYDVFADMIEQYKP